MKKVYFFLPFLFVAQGIHSQTWDWDGPLDPLQAKFHIQKYRLEPEIFPEAQTPSGLATTTFSTIEKLDTLRFQLIDHYHVSKVLMDGKAVAFTHQNDLLDIFPIDCTCDQVEIIYEGPTPIAQNPPLKESSLNYL